MLNLKDIHALVARPERQENSVLTLYLDIDQSRQSNLNRGFESQFKDMATGVKATMHNPEESDSFEKACRQMSRFVEESAVHGRGLVAVFDVSDGFFWSSQLDLPLPNRIQWSTEVLIEPLVAAVDENERVGIVVLDRVTLRVLTMFLGEVQERLHETFDRRKVRRTKTVGMNNLGAASHAQQRVEEHIALNVRQMIKRIQFAVEQQGIGRLILAGSPEITARMKTLMPKRLAALVIGTVDIATSASFDDIRKIAAPLAEAFERQKEREIVSELATAAAKRARVVLGLAHTLNAVNQGRVWRLVYAETFHSGGYECTECGALFSFETASCPICGSAVGGVEDVVERAVAHATLKGAKVEVIRGEEAESALMSAGAIGAFLRTRTASLRAS